LDLALQADPLPPQPPFGGPGVFSFQPLILTKRMSPQAGFLLQDQVLPRLTSAIPQAVSFIGSEDAEELVQDGTLIAAQMIHNAYQAGKQVVKNPGAGRRGTRKLRTISAGNVAFYTIQKLKCGRRSTGSSTVDVYGSGTQINGTTRLTSLDEAAPMTGPDDVGEPLVLHDVLSNDQEDPATKAARKMDWDSFMAGLSARDQAIINCLVEGKPLEQLDSAVSQGTSGLEDPGLHGQRQPGANPPQAKLERQPRCLRERLACREERRHL